MVMVDINHVVEVGIAALAGSVPVLLYIAANKKQARADTERRHQENQALLNGLVVERKYFPAHGHSEKAGPLSAECISYPPEDK